jgi:hypothetical protein
MLTPAVELVVTYLRRLLITLAYVAVWTGLVAVAVVPGRLDSLSLLGFAFVYVLGTVAIVFSEVNALVDERLDEIETMVESSSQSETAGAEGGDDDER